MTSFTSIGYGDVTGLSSKEYMYQMLVELLGIGIFSFMTGLIQGLVLQIGGSDLNEENQELITFWLVKLDGAVKERKLSKQVFDDVRTFSELSFKHDFRSILEFTSSDRHKFFEILKPRLKNQLLDAMFEKKYEFFADVFDDSSKEFVRRVVLNFEFRMYMPDYAKHEGNRFTPMSQLGEKNNIFRPRLIELPFMNKSYNYSTHIHFIQSGKVYIMDCLGLY